MYHSVKMLNIVTRNERHASVSSPNDEDEAEQGNTQDDNKEEEQ